MPQDASLSLGDPVVWKAACGVIGQRLHDQPSIKSSQSSGALVSIGLPVRNGAKTLERVVRSVLAQDYEPVELVVSDNASTDDTEALCRDLAVADDRIVYHRQPTNIGLLGNFIQTMKLAKGSFFRWVGDDDWLAPTCISRCMDAFVEDSCLILVTTQLEYIRPDGSKYTSPCVDSTFRSSDPIERFERYISHLIDGSLPVDPLYGVARRASLLTIARRNTMREDEVFAGKLALAGPWGHVPEVLGARFVRNYGLPELARFLGVPIWQAYLPTSVQCWEMLRGLRTEGITRSQLRRARLAVGRLYVLRHYRELLRRTRKLTEKMA